MESKSSAGRFEDAGLVENRWDDDAAPASPQELLRYRSNLLGSDRRITNFGGGNTSSNSAALEILAPSAP